MEHAPGTRRRFMAYYLLAFALTACYSNFVSLFFSRMGFTKTEIGTLLACGPMIALLAQPFWGMRTDRAKNKNRILQLLLVGSALFVLLYPLSYSFLSALALLVCFYFFQSSVNPVGDTITLEYVRGSGANYGRIRLFGSIGYALAAVAAGALARRNVDMVFWLYAAIALAACAVVGSMPRTAGHQRQGGGQSHAGYGRILRIPGMAAMLAFNLVVHIPTGFQIHFFSIYLDSLGADTMLLGICMFIQAMSELPFLFTSSRLVARFGIQKLMLASTALMGLRWLAMALIRDVRLMPLVSVLHGFSIIVFMYGMTLYISERVPKELRASGQSANAISTFIGSSLVGSMLGGVLSDAFSIPAVYGICVFINLVSVLVFGYLLLIREKKASATTIKEERNETGV